MKTFTQYMAEQDNQAAQAAETCPHCGRKKGPGMCMICGGGYGATTGSVQMPKVTSKAPIENGQLARKVRGPLKIN